MRSGWLYFYIWLSLLNKPATVYAAPKKWGAVRGPFGRTPSMRWMLIFPVFSNLLHNIIFYRMRILPEMMDNDKQDSSVSSWTLTVNTGCEPILGKELEIRWLYSIWTLSFSGKANTDHFAFRWKLPANQKPEHCVLLPGATRLPKFLTSKHRHVEFVKVVIYLFTANSGPVTLACCFHQPVIKEHPHPPPVSSCGEKKFILPSEHVLVWNIWLWTLVKCQEEKLNLLIKPHELKLPSDLCNTWYACLRESSPPAAMRK